MPPKHDKLQSSETPSRVETQQMVESVVARWTQECIEGRVANEDLNRAEEIILDAKNKASEIFLVGQMRPSEAYVDALIRAKLKQGGIAFLEQHASSEGTSAEGTTEKRTLDDVSPVELTDTTILPSESTGDDGIQVTEGVPTYTEDPSGRFAAGENVDFGDEHGDRTFLGVVNNEYCFQRGDGMVERYRPEQLEIESVSPHEAAKKEPDEKIEEVVMDDADVVGKFEWPTEKSGAIPSVGEPVRVRRTAREEYVELRKAGDRAGINEFHTATGLSGENEQRARELVEELKSKPERERQKEITNEFITLRDDEARKDKGVPKEDFDRWTDEGGALYRKGAQLLGETEVSKKGIVGEQRQKQVVPPFTPFMRRVGAYVGVDVAKLNEIPTESLQNAYETADDPRQKAWAQKILESRGVNPEQKRTDEKIKPEEGVTTPEPVVAPELNAEQKSGKEKFQERIQEAVQAIKDGYADTVPESFRKYPEVKASLEEVLGKGAAAEPWPWPTAPQVGGEIASVPVPELDTKEAVIAIPVPEEIKNGLEMTGTEDVPRTDNESPDPTSELDRILRAPSALRRQLLAEYKEKLNTQKKGIGVLQEAVIAEIRRNEQITQPQFLEILKRYVQEYGLTSEQEVAALRSFEKYRRSNDAIIDVRRSFPDDSKLFEASFGRLPKGKIEVVTTPFILYFRCDNIEDYALIYSQKGATGGSVSGEDIQRSEMTRGVAGVSSLINKINGLVGAENTHGQEGEHPDAQSIFAHEEQHAINNILQRTRDSAVHLGTLNRLTSETDEFMIAKDALASAADDEKIPIMATIERARERVLLANLANARQYRKTHADDFARDEILAYKKGGTDDERTLELLCKEKRDGGLYDYLEGQKIRLAQDLAIKFPANNPVHELVPQMYEDVIRVYTKEYQDLLRTGIESYSRLEKAGYTGEAIRSIFQAEELHRWKKVVDRLIGKEEVISGDAGAEKETKESLTTESAVARELLTNETGPLSLTPDQFEKIPEFKVLGQGKQLLVLRELNKYLVANVKGEAVKAYYEKFRAMNTLSDADRKFMEASDWSFFRKAAVGILKVRNIVKSAGMALFKDKWLADKEKMLAADIEKGEVNMEEYVRTLSEMYSTEGPDAVVKDGKLRLQFVSEAEFGGEDSPLPKADIARIEKFNTVAGKFMETPHSWTEHGASKSDRAKYDAMKAEYALALNDILELKRMRGGDERALRDTLDVERAVMFNQFLNSHPDAETEFAKIKDQSSWGRWVMSAARIRSRAFVVGGITRTVATGVLGGVAGAATGLIAAPLAGGVVGGMAGRRNAIRELAEQETIEKIGGDAMTDEEKKKRDEVGGKLALVLQKVREGNADPALLAERDELQKEYDRLDKGRNVVSADGLAGKINRLNERISALEGAEEDIKQIVSEKAGAAPTAEELTNIITRRGLANSGDSWTPETLSLEALTAKRKELAESLEARYWYTKEKVEKGLVDFGALETGLKNKYALLKALGEACATAEVEQRWDGKLKDELRKFIDYKEGAIDKRQAAYKDHKMMQGVKYGIVFGAAGAAVSDVIHGAMSGEGLATSVIGPKSGGNDISESGTSDGMDILLPPKNGTQEIFEQNSIMSDIQGADDEIHGEDRWVGDDGPGMIEGLSALLGRPLTPAEDRVMELLSFSRDVIKPEGHTEAIASAYDELLHAMEQKAPTPLSPEEIRAIVSKHDIGNIQWEMPNERGGTTAPAPHVIPEKMISSGDTLPRTLNIIKESVVQPASSDVGTFTYIDEPTLPEPPPGSGDILGTTDEIAAIAVSTESGIPGNRPAGDVAEQSGKFTYVPEPKLAEPPPGSGDILGTSDEIGRITENAVGAPEPLSSTEILMMIGRYESGIGRAMTRDEILAMREMISFEAFAKNDASLLKDAGEAREAILTAMREKTTGLTPEDISKALASHKLEIIDGKIDRINTIRMS